ncbi:hypothetical protein FHS31_001970 [Sphingomonas vulcanisoli]|uniref:HTH LytTR-type domain-containing protein n=1 Tax=Sphingomonas vulcanisoli TaxID=1658060 RepID=A0ABX0TS62_9SPHN|nr:LytTR family DNA-binding domain-containing protein [Sphingomonas vulcanisoli]NIJ08353.1 hypothetical protein [Sphingomonas vulcanisoli]
MTARIRDIIAELFLMTALGLVMGLIGPMGSFAMPLLPRTLNWIALSLLGYACFRPVIAAGQVLTEQTGLPYGIALVLACAIAAIPTAAIVCWLGAGFQIDRVSLAGMTKVYPYVLIVGGIATAVQLLAFRHRTAAPAATPEPVAAPAIVEAPPPRPAFLDRLPPHLGSDLLALENEDHYVRAHTAQGSTLILMRLRDAVAELEGIEGARVHRSWWVARAAVAEVVRRDRATALRLVNKLDVPVARSELPGLRANGWL